MTEEMDVTIRRAREGDALLMATWRSIPEVRQYQPLWPVPPAQLRRNIRRQSGFSLEEQRGRTLTWIIEADGTPAGWASLRNVDWWAKSASVGFSVAPWAQGKGVARRGVAAVLDLAFTPGRMHRVEADCDVDNERSQRLLERLGFQREGTMRAFARMPQGRRDFYLYSLLNEEWQGSNVTDGRLSGDYQ
ncbi:MAG TPA: GNAT family N-acetyltransferase [Candidatus Dormibacteraeota bacterium]|jgi:RimJ/RimL family protein N-acetyltransferase